MEPEIILVLSSGITGNKPNIGTKNRLDCCLKYIK